MNHNQSQLFLFKELKENNSYEKIRHILRLLYGNHRTGC